MQRQRRGKAVKTFRPHNKLRVLCRPEPASSAVAFLQSPTPLLILPHALRLGEMLPRRVLVPAARRTDSKTLELIAEVGGVVDVAVTAGALLGPLLQLAPVPTHAHLAHRAFRTFRDGRVTRGVVRSAEDVAA